MKKLKSILMSAKLTLLINVVALLSFFITSCAEMTSPKVDSAAKDFDLGAAGNYNATSLWSDGTTMWVGDWHDDKLYAYNLSSKSRDFTKDFNALNSAGNNSISGLWSDGTTMWVADIRDSKIYAYNLLTKARDVTKDFDTLSSAGNNAAVGIWSDGTTMWVMDQLGAGGDGKIYAYNLSSKNRDASKDINTLGADGVNRSYGLWSDGATMWVSDWEDDRLYAYNLLRGVRDINKDFDTLLNAGNNNPVGIWSDGTTMWVADRIEEKVYAYNMSTSLGGGTSSLVIDPINISDATLHIYQNIILATTVSNSGPGLSIATTLRWYLSSDSTISSSDTQVGTDLLYGLSVGSSSGSESITAAPISTPGTYYYGACVDSISGESSTTDNCSIGTSVVVEIPIPDLTVDSVILDTTNSFSSRNPGLFSLTAAVVNSGSGLSSTTTVRYYVSSDSTINRADRELAFTKSVSRLFPGGRERNGLSTTFQIGTSNYYGACVDSVSNEVITTNNCSIGIQLVFD